MEAMRREHWNGSLHQYFYSSQANRTLGETLAANLVISNRHFSIMLSVSISKVLTCTEYVIGILSAIKLSLRSILEDYFVVDPARLK